MMKKTPVGRRLLFLASLSLVSICCNYHVQGFSLKWKYPCNKYASSLGVDGAPLRVTAATTTLFCSPSPNSAAKIERSSLHNTFMSLWKTLWSRTATTTTLTTTDQQITETSKSWKWNKKRKQRIGVALAVICVTTVLAGGVQSAWASTAATTEAPLPAVHLAPMLTRLQEVRLMGRLWYAALLGAAVGKERSSANHHPAGVRTLALVSLGSAAFTLCSMFGFGAAGKFDTSRMASAVASGKFRVHCWYHPAHCF